MRGRGFVSPVLAVAAYRELLDDLIKDEFHKCFENWFVRMGKCLECSGDFLKNYKPLICLADSQQARLKLN
jgi:hypothetical protein